MFHEERVIDDVLHWRGTPDGEFVPYNAIELTSRITHLKKVLNELTRDDLTGE